MSTQGWTTSTAAARRAGVTTTTITQGRGHGKSRTWPKRLMVLVLGEKNACAFDQTWRSDGCARA